MDAAQRVFQDILAGKNVLLQGKAGTGKSTLIREIQNQFPNKKVVITATTGVAASLLNGTTLHSWAGLGLATGDVHKLVLNMKESGIKRWRETEILVIDEISMLSQQTFDKFSMVGQRVRGDKKRAFGGIQLVVVGDFLQLPPVVDKNYKKGSPLFAFEAKHWELARFQRHVLTHVWRQTDARFVGALDELRVGRCSSETRQLLLQCVGKKLPEIDGIKPSKLFCTRSNVDYQNGTELRRLPGNAVIYTAKDHGDVFQLNRCLWPATLSLKVGAQVMHLKNDMSRDLVNGSRGIVVGIEEKTSNPRIRFDNGKTCVVVRDSYRVEQGTRVVATRMQYPLCLAWALTVHKSQGCTLKQAVVDVANAFEAGQVYVALSRVKSLDGLSLTSFSPDRIVAHPKALEFETRAVAPTLAPNTRAPALKTQRAKEDVAASPTASQAAAAAQTVVVVAGVVEGAASENASPPRKKRKL